MRIVLPVAVVGLLAAGFPSYAGPDDEAAAALALAKARHTVRATVDAPPAPVAQPVVPPPAYYYPAAPVVAAPRPFASVLATTPGTSAPTAAPVNTASPGTTATGRTITFAPAAGRHGATSGCST